MSSLQLLSDASNGCLEVHHGDALDFDMEKLCGPYVDRRAWEDGENIIIQLEFCAVQFNLGFSHQHACKKKCIKRWRLEWSGNSNNPKIC